MRELSAVLNHLVCALKNNAERTFHPADLGLQDEYSCLNGRMLRQRGFLVREDESAGHLDPPNSWCINGEVVVLTERLEGAKETKSVHLFCHLLGYVEIMAYLMT